MSNTGPEPCSRVRPGYRGLYVAAVRHYSYALRPDDAGPGRTGPTICGVAGAADQQRINHLLAGNGYRVRLHELRICRSCAAFMHRAHGATACNDSHGRTPR